MSGERSPIGFRHVVFDPRSGTLDPPSAGRLRLTGFRRACREKPPRMATTSSAGQNESPAKTGEPSAVVWPCVTIAAQARRTVWRLHHRGRAAVRCRTAAPLWANRSGGARLSTSTKAFPTGGGGAQDGVAYPLLHARVRTGSPSSRSAAPQRIPRTNRSCPGAWCNTSRPARPVMGDSATWSARACHDQVFGRFAAIWAVKRKRLQDCQG